MALITLPSQDFEKLTVELDQNFQVNRSEWTGRRRITGMPGLQKWYVSASIPALTTEMEERPWRAFFAAARGPVNSFAIQVACSQRTGSNPTVRAGATAGNTLPVAGMPASATVLQAGQYLTAILPSGRWRLLLLTADLTSNSSGLGTASFEPALTEIPATGSSVETIDPFIVCSLLEGRQGWTVDNGVTAITIAAEEAL
ncbi:hypothetical protein [Sphingobium sp. BS19]|uniref:hypothetical protein n=1 Tax=Sphingobium sp. BS19 TaxID=3018973 RepID=UPI0022EEA3A5|nr:hypothetical protein [Sphingobium sp. BS19]GLI99115.1 hypothetical protein Sbs19_29330 [Sphingobium sp. BS19]